MTKQEFKSFNASSVSLAGSNLIEASAGTGKTYSIAILTLRLVLENKISINEILMVTFTKAAVAELEERIRLFIRQGYKVSRGEAINDSTITALVQEAIRHSGAKKVEQLLNDAVLLLDETAVLTIHSFCQETLNEFAFETGQLFGAELLQNTSGLLEEEINRFWREKITSIPSDLLQSLLSNQFSRSSIIAVANAHLEGNRYFIYDPKVEYTLSEQDYLDYVLSLQQVNEQQATAWEELVQSVINDAENLKAKSESNGHTRKANLPTLVDEPESFLDFIWMKRSTKYVNNLFPELLESLANYDELLKQEQNLIQELIRNLNCWAISEVAKGIENKKLFNNQLSFNDLIFKLHEALVKRENPELVSCLQQKYKAVFIDEFQDTDRMQYELFSSAFGDDTILFYIGDPKQSIYAWRKADIFTYFKAKETVDHLYGMNQNYRSSAPLIKAMNQFFRPVDTFDTFHFKGADSSIDYIAVESPDSNIKGNLMVGDEIEVPISISESSNKDSILTAVAGQVVDLLSSNTYFIQEKKCKRPVQPADIGVLVRSNREGQNIKAILSKYGIPAVTIGDAKVLQTDEARSLFFVLVAIVDISIASINKALLSPFTQFNDRDILSLDEEASITLFRNYKIIWEKDGIYTALNTFIHDFNVKITLLSQHSESGERLLTNIFQLIELLHKTQNNKNLSPLELIAWLKRGMEGDEQEGDDFEQRIESDEDSIKIVTIHKSKGLEYNIVLAPFLDLLTYRTFTTCSYRDAESGEYISIEMAALSEEQNEEYVRQLEQENRRLIYVAITRAVYKCFIFKNTLNKGPYNCTNSSLAPFINACDRQENNLIRFSDELSVPAGYFYSQADPQEVVIRNKPVHFNLLQPYWRKMSYSMLRADHELSLKSKSDNHKEPYDQFIFSQLTKGAKTGNMLHYLFENIAFNHDGRWNFAIENAIQRYAPLRAALYTPMFRLMLDQVLNASISVGEEVFKLSDISTEHSIHELEFDFSVSSFQVTQLAMLSDDHIDVRVKDYSEIEGVMNGKIDLFFEHNGKYFVLDWKSNYLGDSVADYIPDRLAVAMNENNYHLQHLIYSLATKKYLESRLPNFDYETQFGGVIYLFLRGLRKNAETGVYTYKPSLEKMESLEGMLGKKKHQLS